MCLLRKHTHKHVGLSLLFSLFYFGTLVLFTGIFHRPYETHSFLFSSLFYKPKDSFSVPYETL